MNRTKGVVKSRWPGLFYRPGSLYSGWFLGCLMSATAAAAEPLFPLKAAGSLRLATYNVSMHRSQAGALQHELAMGASQQVAAVASVIRGVQPDVLLLNEIDYSAEASNAQLFERNFLSSPARDSLGNAAWALPFIFSGPVNTGVPSGLDLNRNDRQDDPEDAWGFGVFPGQYGMALLSRFELERAGVHTLQMMRWSVLPGALRPQFPPVAGQEAPQYYYDQAAWEQLRLSSKSFWDIPVQTALGRLHVLASHPTPPAFDGPEDRNGCRNHDEIKLIQHYIDAANFLVDDAGGAAGLAPHDAFVVMGDLNSDPVDGNSRSEAIMELLKHPRVAQFAAPRSLGAKLAAQQQAGMNRSHRGDPAEDTGDFNDRSVGNLRIDYVLPSRDWQVVAAGVFWPDLQTVPAALRGAVEQALQATDHHLVWVDVIPAAR
jgi:endonuclease/exonuclease/phosphatase family metal-dependent hydrolase